MDGIIEMWRSANTLVIDSWLIPRLQQNPPGMPPTFFSAKAISSSHKSSLGNKFGPLTWNSKNISLTFHLKHLFRHWTLSTLPFGDLRILWSGLPWWSGLRICLAGGTSGGDLGGRGNPVSQGYVRTTPSRPQVTGVLTTDKECLSSAGAHWFNPWSGDPPCREQLSLCDTTAEPTCSTSEDCAPWSALPQQSPRNEKPAQPEPSPGFSAT